MPPSLHFHHLPCPPLTCWESTDKHPSEEAKPAATHPRRARHVQLRFPMFAMSCTLSAATCSFLFATVIPLLGCAVLTLFAMCWGLCVSCSRYVLSLVSCKTLPNTKHSALVRALMHVHSYLHTPSVIPHPRLVPGRSQLRTAVRHTSQRYLRHHILLLIAPQFLTYNNSFPLHHAPWETRATVSCFQNQHRSSYVGDTAVKLPHPVSAIIIETPNSSPQCGMNF